MPEEKDNKILLPYYFPFLLSGVMQPWLDPKPNWVPQFPCNLNTSNPMLHHSELPLFAKIGNFPLVREEVCDGFC